MELHYSSPMEKGKGEQQQTRYGAEMSVTPQWCQFPSHFNGMSHHYTIYKDLWEKYVKENSKEQRIQSY